MLDSIATDPQPCPTGNGADVTDLVVKDLLVRREMGTRKYGTSLKTNNGRNAAIDLYQELCDAVLYARQLIEEERSDRIKFEKAADLMAERDEMLQRFREIGKIIGCGHVEDSDGRQVLVRCIRETVEAAGNVVNPPAVASK